MIDLNSVNFTSFKKARLKLLAVLPQLLQSYSVRIDTILIVQQSQDYQYAGCHSIP